MASMLDWSKPNGHEIWQKTPFVAFNGHRALRGTMRCLERLAVHPCMQPEVTRWTSSSQLTQMTSHDWASRSYRLW